VCAERPGLVPVRGAPAMSVEHGLDCLKTADTVVVPGQAELGRLSDMMRAALAEAAARGVRIVSICTGAFVLAAAGLLDGPRATTHWQHAASLGEQYPRGEVAPKALYVDEGEVLTSAGVAAGLDLCLHLVRRDHGAHMANQRARALVTAPHRTGGQAQYTGQPPMRWLLEARLNCARELLESTDLTVEGVARRCGLGTPASFRTLFKENVGVTPSTCRGTFRFTTGDAPATRSGACPVAPLGLT